MSNSTDLLSHCITQESHLEFIISTLCSKEANTSFHLCLRTMHPAHGISHVHLCSATGTSNSTNLLSHCVTQENHLKYHLNSLQGGGQHNVPVLSQIGTTHPTQGLSLRSVSWRMSHAVVIINTPSQLGRHSPSSQVSHGTTRTLSWL
jgi:hypothetical protein